MTALEHNHLNGMGLRYFYELSSYIFVFKKYSPMSSATTLDKDPLFYDTDFFYSIEKT